MNNNLNNDNSIILSRKEFELAIENAILKARLEDSQKENNKKEEFIRSSKLTPQVSISVRQFIKEQYTNAPLLKPLPDYGKSLKAHQSKDKATRGHGLIATLVYYHGKRRLHAYLGGFLVPHYKMGDPMFQSMWMTDKGRFTFLIREQLEKTKSYWTVDPKGQKVKDKVVFPLLNYLKVKIDEHLKAIAERAEEMDAEQQLSLHDDRIQIEDVRSAVNNELADRILSYIAPYFYMDMTENHARIEYMNNKKLEQYDEDLRTKKVYFESELIDSADYSSDEENYIVKAMKKIRDDIFSKDMVEVDTDEETVSSSIEDYDN